MALALSGKVAVVTGSSRSTVGASIATRLAHDGARVVVNYLSGQSDAESLVAAITTAGGNAVAVQADVSTVNGARKLVDEAVKAYGRIDILVLNAGVMTLQPLEQTDEDTFDLNMNGGVKGPFFVTKYAAPVIPEGACGRVVFISSSLTIASAVNPAFLLYCAAKGAIEQLSRVLAKDLGRRHITVNTVSPGPTDTASFRAAVPPPVLEQIVAENPQKRLGTPKDVANAVAMLVKPEAGWINGANVRVNGGLVV